MNYLMQCCIFYQKKLYKFQKNAKEASKKFSLKKMIANYEKTYNEFIQNNK